MGDWVYDRLRHAIFEGELEPGERLSVPALAELLQVSRSPVREAVQRLVQERLAVESPHQGAVVAEVGADGLERLYEVREVLEGLAARLAAGRADDDQVGELARLFDQHREVVRQGDLERHLELDQGFHRLVRHIAGNGWLNEYLDQIQSQVRLAMLSTSVTAGPPQAIKDHEAILAAVRARDESQAEAAARQHIARLRRELQRAAKRRVDREG